MKTQKVTLSRRQLTNIYGGKGRNNCLRSFVGGMISGAAAGSSLGVVGVVGGANLGMVGGAISCL